MVYGHEQVERLSVSVSSSAGGSTPTGKVAVQDFPHTVCVITLSAGRGSCTLKATQLPGGTYSLIARYSGSPVFDTSFSAQKLLLVDKATSKTSLKLSAAMVRYGREQMERLSVSVSSNAGGPKPSGKVAVKKSATKTVCVITLSAAKGSCTLKATQLPGGTYRLVAAYSGSLDFGTSISAKQTLTVTGANTRPKKPAKQVYFWRNLAAIVRAPGQPPQAEVVRPSLIYLFADGSWVIDHLHWTGWGSSVAQANGISSASTGNPSQAGGKRITTPGKISLSNPVQFYGHEVYRCFKLTVPAPATSLHGCLTGHSGSWGLYP